MHVTDNEDLYGQKPDKSPFGDVAGNASTSKHRATAVVREPGSPNSARLDVHTAASTSMPLWLLGWL